MPTSVRSHIHELTRRLRSERGIALPAALMMLLVISALSAVAATAATNGADQATRDKGSKRALAGGEFDGDG